MRRSIAWTGGAVLAAALALPAAAQTSGEAGQQEQAAGGQRTADQMTCAEIAMMDTAVVPGTLYFIAGYEEGRGTGMGQGSADVSAVTGTSATPSATGGDTGSGTGGDAAAGTDPGGATGLAGTGTGTTGESGTGDAATEGATGGHQVAAISGFFEIPVEQVMEVCAEAPERTVSDVMREQGGDEGAGGSSD